MPAPSSRLIIPRYLKDDWDTAGADGKLSQYQHSTRLHQPKTISEVLSTLLTTRGDVLRRGASAAERLALGQVGRCLASDGTDAVWAGGRIVAMVSSTTSAVSTTTSQIPFDDTLPQSGEGIQVTSLTHAPQHADNLLLVIGWAMLNANPSPYRATLSLFRSDSANARAASMDTGDIGWNGTPVVIQPPFAAGATTSRTWSTRAGLDRAGTLTINGDAGNRRFSTMPKSGLLLLEIAA